jgi:hypothetical protein
MKHDRNRVLGRSGARELTPEEVARIVASGPQITDVITFNPYTGQRDGDGWE